MTYSLGAPENTTADRTVQPSFFPSDGAEQVGLWLAISSQE